MDFLARVGAQVSPGSPARTRCPVAFLRAPLSPPVRAVAGLPPPPGAPGSVRVTAPEVHGAARLQCHGMYPGSTREWRRHAVRGGAAALDWCCRPSAGRPTTEPTDLPQPGRARSRLPP